MRLKNRSHPEHASVAGTNLLHARSHNRRAVLEIVRRAGSISRAEIARRSALTLQTVSNIVEELEANGFLKSGASIKGPRGQPYLPYSINPQGAWTLGFHVARHQVIGTLVDLAGNVIATQEAQHASKGPADASEVTTRLSGALIREARVPQNKILGIGFALPTRFDLGPLSTAGPTGLPGWSDPAKREEFRNAFFAPVHFENDAVAAAIGERLYGVARDMSNFVLLYLEDGLGAGLFLNGQPFKGAFSGAGEIGHMVVSHGGKPCPCGNRGCLERYVSLRAAYEAIEPGAADETPHDVVDVLNEHLEQLEPWMAEAGQKLANTINILETMIDPETIIIGGLAPQALVEKLIAASKPLPVSVGDKPDRKHPRVMPGSLGRHSTAYGAAALPIFEEINPRFDILLKKEPVSPR
jgi:predicted NBD/HSP70 family sugar kinase